MEHRCSERVDTDVRVLIYKSGTPQAIGRIKNGSKYGFFVETDFDDINIFQALDVEILLPQVSSQASRHKYAARVIRKSGNGLGLELELVSRDSGVVLDKLLRSANNRKDSNKFNKTGASNVVPAAVKVAQVK